MRPVMIWVQHLLGIGHLMRVGAIVRELVNEGVDVVLVSGGEPVPVFRDTGARFVQLPPCRATDKSFKVLTDENGAVIDDAWKARRTQQLLDLLDSVNPGILVTELFPFGRRQFRFELLPLLEAARQKSPSVKTVASVRDILVQKAKPERNEEMLNWARTLYDHVLVHGDPELVPLDVTFPHVSKIADKIRYTGYVVDAGRLGAIQGDGNRHGVIVSAGGGGVGEPLLRAAMEARAETVLKDQPWRLLAGYNLPEETYQALRDMAPDGVVVERARDDFVALLSEATLSVSQGGYNTVMETLASGVRSIIVPYAGGEETEQTLRARLLEERGVLDVLNEDALNGKALAALINRVMGRSDGASRHVAMNGAQQSTAFLKSLLHDGQMGS